MDSQRFVYSKKNKTKKTITFLSQNVLDFNMLEKINSDHKQITTKLQLLMLAYIALLNQ